MRQDVGRALTVREVLLEKQVLEVIERQPAVSTRRLASRTYTCLLSFCTLLLTRRAVVSLSH
jgi:hypothetical protein